MNRAYSIVTVKAVSEDERIIEGVASTPSVDRMGDIVEPMGAAFNLPLAFLWQHDAGSPIGHVEMAKPTKDGITFRARIAKIDEPGELKNTIDKAWQAIRAGLVRGVSIGFRVLEHSVMKEGGWRIHAWEWLELSAVTIPANSEATISKIKSIDTELRAALGKADGDERPDEPIPEEPEVPAAIGKKARVVKLDAPTRARVAPFVIRSIKRN